MRDAVHIAGVTDTQPIHAIMLVAPLSVSTHGRRGGGDRGGGAGAEPGGKGGNGGEGGRDGEHAPKPPQAEPYRTANSALPNHAQRMRTLFASDKPFAFCLVERGEGGMRGRETGGVAAAQAARREDPAVKAAGRARAERTKNMDPMYVTLDVSKLSGWLNAYAICQARREA